MTSYSSAVGFSSENPHVHNPNYFANQPHVIYSETKTAMLFRINFFCASTFGLVGVAFVTWLVLYRTPTHFKPYSKMLLLCAGSDIYVIIGDFLCQTRLKVTSSYMIAVLNGPASMLPYSLQCLMLGWQASAAVLASCCLPVQYYIRFYTIKNSKAPSGLRILCFYILACIAAFISVFTTYASFDFYDNPEKIAFEKYWYNEVPVPQLLVGSQKNPLFLWHVGYICLSMISSYVLCIFLSKKTIREMQRRSLHLTIKTRSLQKQFARMLFAQSLCPLLTTIIPVLGAVFAMYLNTNTQNLGDVVVASVNWFPFLNSCTNIFLIIPYRQQFLRMVAPCKNKSRLGRPSSTVPMPSTINVSSRQLAQVM